MQRVGNTSYTVREVFTHDAFRYFSCQKSKMATNMAETSATEKWDNFFEELGHLLTDYETLCGSTDFKLQEKLFIRMESALFAFQHVIPLAVERGLNYASVLQEIFTNFRLLFLGWTRHRET